jgi:hypothetical protein
VKVGDLVQFKKADVPNPRVFIVYKIYRDSSVDVVFLVDELGKHGAFTAGDLCVVSEAKNMN